MRKFLAVLTLLASVSAQADMTYGEFTSPQYRSATELRMVTISAFGQGFGWANIELERTGRTALYCQPPKMVMTPDGYMSILEAHVSKLKQKNVQESAITRVPLGLLLLKSLIATYPCQ